MKAKATKTNAMRILDSLSIQYTVHSYEWDEENLDAIHAASNGGFDLEKTYKTIVMINESKKLFVFCLPAEFDISLKKARALTDSKSIDLLKTSELQKYTGYVRGGCSPLGMIHQYPTFISELAELEESVYVSAGERGRMIELNPEDLKKAANAEFADFI